MPTDNGEPEGIAHWMFVKHGRATTVFWAVIGLASVVLLVLNLREDGWDTGAVSNVLMIVSSIAGVVVTRTRARELRDE